jgi:hypothetical protein
MEKKVPKSMQQFITDAEQSKVNIDDNKQLMDYYNRYTQDGTVVS